MLSNSSKIAQKPPKILRPVSAEARQARRREFHRHLYHLLKARIVPLWHDSFRNTLWPTDIVEQRQILRANVKRGRNTERAGDRNA